MAPWSLWMPALLSGLAAGCPQTGAAYRLDESPFLASSKSLVETLDRSGPRRAGCSIPGVSGMVCVGRDIRDHLIPAPTWPGAIPGMGHSPLLCSSKTSFFSCHYVSPSAFL